MVKGVGRRFFAEKDCACLVSRDRDGVTVMFRRLLLRFVRSGFKPFALKCGALLGLSVLSVSAQIPSILTDKLYRGSGEIDLLKNVSSADLASYLNNNGGLLLGVDVNENAAGNESSTPLGVALRDVQLLLETTAGSYSFTDFFTNTTAMIREAGSATSSLYYTMFGQGGSSQLTSGTSGFDISKFDDVLQMQNIVFAGEITGARLVVNLLATDSKGGANESFFDFSGGFEDFAILSPEDARILDAAAIGIAGASSELVFTTSDPVLSADEPVIASTPMPAVAPGAPAPPLLMLIAAGALLWWRDRRKETIRAT